MSHLKRLLSPSPFAVAIRRSIRSPVVTGIAIVTLGLGIGVNAAMFNVVDRVFLRAPPHVVRPRQLRRLFVTTRTLGDGETTSGAHPYAFYSLARRTMPKDMAVGAFTPTLGRIGGDGSSYQAEVTYATSTYFSTLGVRAYLGRLFLPSEDDTSVGSNAAILSYGNWQAHFGGDSTIVGQTIKIGTQRFVIVGVAPSGFSGVERRSVDVWVPMSARAQGASPDWMNSWDASWVRIVVRSPANDILRKGLSALTLELRRNYIGLDRSEASAVVSARSLLADDAGAEPGEIALTRVLYGVSTILFFVALLNVMNLTVARGLRRRREFGIRLALGAGRSRLALELLMETFWVVLVGGLAGVLASVWATALIGRTLLPDLSWGNAGVDWRMIAVPCVCVCFATLTLAVLPAASIDAERLTEGLSGHDTISAGRPRARTVVQTLQVALSTVLLVAAVLFARSLRQIHSTNLGIQPYRVIVAAVSFSPTESVSAASRANSQPSERARFVELLEAVRQMSGVESASLVIGAPYYSEFKQPVHLPGQLTPLRNAEGDPDVSAISPDYFRTIGAHLTLGRSFAPSDVHGANPVAIINVAMARTLWLGQHPLGQCIVIGTMQEIACARIVGVVADADQLDIRKAATAHVYVPLGQEHGILGPLLVVRPLGEAGTFVAPLRTALRTAEPDADVGSVRTLDDVLAPVIRPWRVGSIIFGAFGLTTLALAIIGMFTLISYIVAQRNHEFAIRIALGAGPKHIILGVTRPAAIVSIVGVVTGTCAFLFAAPFLEPLLFGVSATDVGSIAAVAALLVFTTIVAASVPAVRAAGTNPLDALKQM